MKEKRKKEISRPPIVVFLGHVDHGKTTLLDTIRKTNVASREAGGITQSTSASQITTKEDRKVTFIDTPGHSVFSEMRARGAKLADIAVLVVAGDDGVKPQTKEALQYIVESKIPYLVTVTKIDLPSANVEMVKSQLEKEGVHFEGRGGEIPLVEVSSKKDQGIDKLLETIFLLTDIYEIKGSEEGELAALVIETGKDKKGPYVVVAVKNGTLKLGDQLESENRRAKVRGIFDSQGKSIKVVTPGEVAQVLGFSDLPPVGAELVIFGKGGEVASNGEISFRSKNIEAGKAPIVLKAKNSGSLEAIISNIPDQFYIVESSIGDLSESDVFMAKSTKAKIFVFESKVPSSVAKLAETEGVQIETFRIIYELFDRLKKLLEEDVVEVLGKAKILGTFPFNSKKVAGCKIVEGRILRSDQLQLMREDEQLGDVKIISMKKGKQDIDIAKQGEELGIIFVPQLEFAIGDVLTSVRK